jgi:hypothetical protein
MAANSMTAKSGLISGTSFVPLVEMQPVQISVRPNQALPKNMVELLEADGEQGPTSLVIACLSNSDLSHCASVSPGFGKNAMEEFCHRVETFRPPNQPPKTEAEKLQNRAELASLDRPALTTRYVAHHHTTNQTFWDSFRDDRRMTVFMPRSAEPRFLELAKTLEDNFCKHVGTRVDMLALKADERRSVHYLTQLSDRSHKVWRELSNDARIHLFMAHPSQLEPSQFKTLAERMESHNTKFLRNPQVEVEGNQRDYRYFTQLASTIQRSPMPAESRTLDCDNRWRNTEWSHDPRGQSSCRCLGPSCAGITTAFVTIPSVFKFVSGCVAAGIGIGASACVTGTCCVYTCCVIPHQAQKERTTRIFHERVQLARAPGPPVHLIAAPAGPHPAAAAAAE